MSTRLSDLDNYRKWQGYGTGYPVGIYTISAGSMKNFTGCESNPTRSDLPLYECSSCHLLKRPRLKDGLCEECYYGSVQTATVPTDGRCKIHRVALYPDGICPVCDYEKCKEPMTLERAVAVLNEHGYRKDGRIGIHWLILEGMVKMGELRLTEFEAIAIAEKLEREAATSPDAFTFADPKDRADFGAQKDGTWSIHFDNRTVGQIEDDLTVSYFGYVPKLQREKVQAFVENLREGK